MSFRYPWAVAAVVLLALTGCGGEAESGGAAVSLALTERALADELRTLEVAFHPADRTCEALARTPTAKAVYRFIVDVTEASGPGTSIEGLFAMPYRVFVVGQGEGGRTIARGCAADIVDVKVGEVSDVKIQLAPL